MEVDDVYRIGKYTVFVGMIHGLDGLVEACVADLYVDGDLVASINIEGEDFFRYPLRAVRTQDVVSNIHHESLVNKSILLCHK